MSSQTAIAAVSQEFSVTDNNNNIEEIKTANLYSHQHKSASELYKESFHNSSANNSSGKYII